eukprot:9615098-Ditylum_brightwellii.AAC.1
MDECIQFATDGKMAFTASQVLTTATYAVQQMDGYSELHEEEQITAKKSLFHQSNVMENISTALDNLANAAVVERKTMQELVTSNKVLTEINALLANQVKNMQDQYAQLKEIIYNVRNNQRKQQS